MTTLISKTTCLLIVRVDYVVGRDLQYCNQNSKLISKTEIYMLDIKYSKNVENTLKS